MSHIKLRHFYYRQHAHTERKTWKTSTALLTSLFCLSIPTPESARVFCQRSWWLLNMIDHRICVCHISPVNRQQAASCQTLLVSVAYQRACLSGKILDILHYAALQTPIVYCLNSLDAPCTHCSVTLRLIKIKKLTFTGWSKLSLRE